MNKYQRGKIYKIESDSIDGVYIGSTCQPTLARRLAGHITNYKRWQNGKHGHMSSFDLLINNDYHIVLLETYQCNTKDELYARERHFIQNTENCINKYKNVGLCNELGEDEYNKQRHKQYRKDHKEHLYQKHICVCGGNYTTINKSRHIKTLIHIQYIALTTPIIYEPYILNIQHFDIDIDIV